MPGNQIGFGVATQSRSNILTLHSGQTFTPPSGQYLVTLGPYTTQQWYDAQTQTWKNYQTPANSDLSFVSSDGYNFRVMNLTGTMVGAYLTNGGSGYPNGIYPAASTNSSQTNYVLATVSAAGAQSSLVGGLAKCNVIVGGAISTTVTVTVAGSGFTHPPQLIFSNPPIGGIPASGYVSSLSSGGIGTVVVTNQGAGYTTAPTITVVPMSPDTSSTVVLPTLTATLTLSGSVTAITMADNGSAYAAVPTIAFTASAGSSAAATAVMCMSATGISAVSGGSANLTDNTGAFTIISQPVAGSKTSAPVNPNIEAGLFMPRVGWGTITTSSGVASAMTIVDGGLHELVGTGATTTRIVPSFQWTTAAPTSTPTGTLALGGNVDTINVTQF